MLLTRHSNLKDELSIWGIDSYQRTGVQNNVTDTFFFCFCHLYPSIQHICAIVWMPFNVLIMLYWSTTPSAVFQKISTFQRLPLLRAAKPDNWSWLDSVFLPGNVFQDWRTTVTKTKEKHPDVLSLFKNRKKIQGKKSEEGLGVRGGLPESIFLSVNFIPSLPFMVSIVCDLSVRRVTWVLLIGLTPTDRLTLERSGRMRLGTPATQQN